MRRSDTPVTPETFIVVMDYPNAQTGRMPRGFYRDLEKLQGVTRLQKSVYEVTPVSRMRELTDLGRAYGFSVQSFQVANGRHRCDKGGNGEIEHLTRLFEEHLRARLSTHDILVLRAISKKGSSLLNLAVDSLCKEAHRQPESIEVSVR